MDITANSGQWHPEYIDPATDFGFKRIVFFMNFKDKNPKHAQPLSHFAFMKSLLTKSPNFAVWFISIDYDRQC
jgi:hypothetical protein